MINNNSQWLTTSAVANLLGISSQTVRTWIGNGTLPAYQISQRGRIMVKARDVADMINSRRITTEPIPTHQSRQSRKENFVMKRLKRLSRIIDDVEDMGLNPNDIAIDPNSVHIVDDDTDEEDEED